jgi:hypothetical protein
MAELSAEGILRGDIIFSPMTRPLAFRRWTVSRPSGWKLTRIVFKAFSTGIIFNLRGIDAFQFIKDAALVNIKIDF